MTITVQELVSKLDAADDNFVITLDHEGTFVYADSIVIGQGEVIISSQPWDDADDETEE